MGIPAKNRSFLNYNTSLKEWEDIRHFYEKLENRKVNSIPELKKWLEDRSELDAFVSENFAWRYINFTRNTTDKAVKEHYQYFVNKIRPLMAPYEDKLNNKFLSFESTKKLESEKYKLLTKLIEKDIKLFRKENIPLFTEITNNAEKYSTITSQMTVKVEGKELTMQQASKHLEDTDRNHRKEVFDKISERRLQNRDELDELYSKLIELRAKVAKNAGFQSFRDFMFEALARFDYTIEDNLQLHDSIRDEIVPLLRKIHLKRKHDLDVDSLKPYDLQVDAKGEKPLRPFETGKELVDMTINCFNGLDNKLGSFLQLMQKNDFLDIDSRKGKAPGGYNYPLEETGIPFIFMNASGKLQDVVTMTHEGGHAIHSFLTRHLDLVYFKQTPSEVAELASMSMELISMDYWDEFFPDKQDLNRAKRQHISDILGVLPWIAIIDKFQHWIYTHPKHSNLERDTEWIRIFDEFTSGIVDWKDYELYKSKQWQRQGHLFDVPFYYIEYAIAQLGAIAIWKNYKENKDKGLQDYLNALKLGYTCGIPSIYKTAGIKFDFSREYIHELAEFLGEELEKLKL